MSLQSATIATICARGSSKGLPGKNIRDFGGRPLIVHSIEQALACPAIDGVYVSTDDEEIARISQAAGALVPYLRPPDMASDAAPKLPALEHLVSWVEQNAGTPERIVDLQPTSPLRATEDIDAALQASLGAELVVSVCEAQGNPYFNLVERAGDGRVALSKGHGSGRRQDVPTVYMLNGSIYVWQRSALRKAAAQGLWSVQGLEVYVMPKCRSVDIDDIDDFEHAAWLFARQKKGFP